MVGRAESAEQWVPLHRLAARGTALILLAMLVSAFAVPPLFALHGRMVPLRSASLCGVIDIRSLQGQPPILSLCVADGPTLEQAMEIGRTELGAEPTRSTDDTAKGLTHYAQYLARAELAESRPRGRNVLFSLWRKLGGARAPKGAFTPERYWLYIDSPEPVGVRPSAVNFPAAGQTTQDFTVDCTEQGTPR